MRFFRPLLFMAFLFIGGHAAAEDAKCWKRAEGFQMEKGQQAMNACAVADFEKLDAMMNELYQQQLTYLKDTANQSNLQKAQKDWLAYRESACWYESAPTNGGSMEPMVEYLCKASLTKKHIEQLKDYLQCRENPCPN